MSHCHCVDKRRRDWRAGAASLQDLRGPFSRSSRVSWCRAPAHLGFLLLMCEMPVFFWVRRFSAASFCFGEFSFLMGQKPDRHGFWGGWYSAFTPKALYLTAQGRERSERAGGKRPKRPKRTGGGRGVWAFYAEGVIPKPGSEMQRLRRKQPTPSASRGAAALGRLAAWPPGVRIGRIGRPGCGSRRVKPRALRCNAFGVKTENQSPQNP